MSLRVLDLDGDKFVLKCLYVDREIAKGVPGALWNPHMKRWEYPASYEAYEALRTRIGNLEVTKRAHAAAMKAAMRAAEKAKAKIGGAFDIDTVRSMMPIRTQAFCHQVIGFALAYQGLGLGDVVS